MIKTIESNLIIAENGLDKENELKVKSNAFVQLMNIYSQAIKEVEKEINKIDKEKNLIDHIKTRIKSPKSIINKMNSKNYALTYQNLIENINDIAGIRIITSSKTDVYIIKKLIEKNTNMVILKEKDYIAKPKKSGYMSLHLIVEVPLNIKEQIVFVKAEIQIRTTAMDLWSNLEHEIKYKPKDKVSRLASKKLIKYAKMLNKIETEMTKMYNM